MKIRVGFGFDVHRLVEGRELWLGGIKAIWNFTPFRIRVPENIVVQNTSLYAHLAVMFNRLNETIKK